MSDEQMTTESQDNPETTDQSSGSVLGSGTVGDNQNWRDTLPEELKMTLLYKTLMMLNH